MRLADHPTLRLVLAVAGVGLLVGATAAVAISLTNAPAVQDGPYYGQPNGPKVSFPAATKLNMSSVADNGTFYRLQSNAGNASFRSPGDTKARVDNLEGTWTNTTDLDVVNGPLWINPPDKPAANVSGDADSFNFTGSIAADDGTPDFVFRGTSGTTTVTVRGLAADTQYFAVDGNDDVLAVATSDANGVATFSGMTNSKHVVSIQSNGAGPALSDVNPQGNLNFFPTELNATVDDPDFPGDDVDVEFYLDGTLEGTVTRSTAGEASVSIAKPGFGDHNLTVVATDAGGNTDRVETTFRPPSDLSARNSTYPYGLINITTVRFTFFETDGDIVRRTTNTGTVSLEGLNVDSPQIPVRVTADRVNKPTAPDLVWSDWGYVVDDITQQQSTYLILLNETNTVEVRFTLRDRSGGTFSNNNATLRIQKPINRTGKPKWVTVWGDEFGAAGTQTELEEGQRYRLLVKNDQGDKRVLGTYTPTVSETVQLEVGSVTADPNLGNTPAAVGYNVSYLQDQNPRQILVQYNDTDDATSELYVEIYERGNESNVLLSNQSFAGPLGTVGLTETVPNAQNNTTYVVRITAQRDGSQFRAQEVVGPRRPVLQGLPTWLKILISIGSIWVVAGLFSKLNGAVGGLVVAALGGLWWFVDFLPPNIGVGVVVLSMLIAGVLFINDRRDGGL